MTTGVHDTGPRPRPRPSARGVQSFWSYPKGWRSWLLTKDHKRIGVLYFFATSFFLFMGGVFAMIIRISLVSPENALVNEGTYNKLFTHHGIIMVFLFMVPAIPSAFGNFMLPIMVGARDVAFPKINLASFYVYSCGAILILVALIGGGVDTGWTFYAPYSTTSPTAVWWATIGVFCVGVSSIMTGLNFIVTVHTERAAGIRWKDIPLFVWAIYGTAVIQIIATPVLGMSVLLVAVDHLWRLGLFEAATGGDPVLFEHLFWFYSHPAVYIMILPAMGVVSEVVSTMSHRRPAWYGGIVIATFGISLVGFLSWGHHLFVSGMSTFDVGMFGILSMLVAIFSAIKVFAWTSTMYGGSISITTPMLYVYAFIFLFIFGGMTGVAVATTSLDVHWTDTYFIVAHFHFIMVGGTITGFFCAIHYWFPKITGKMYSEKWAMVACVGISLGFLVTFTPQFLLGNAGMPRRWATYPQPYQWLNVISTVGAGMLAIGMITAAVYLLYAFWNGPLAGENPWRSMSFEWRCPSPPPHENFPEPPHWTKGAYDYPVEAT